MPVTEPSTIIGAFSEEQASALSHVSVNQLRSWDREGFFRPSFADLPRVPFGRVYSFRDIVSLRVLNDLRNAKKIPLSHLRVVSEELSHLGESRWTATTLYVLGKRVVYVDPRSQLRQEAGTGQRVFEIPLRVVVASTKKAVQELNRRDDKLGQITQARFVANNEPVIAGTRVPVAAIREFALAGYSPEQIIREYPGLTDLDVKAALAGNPEALAA